MSVIARMTSEMTPTTCGAPKLLELKKNPVTLVAIVVTRKTAVQPGNLCARHRPIATTTPQAMAMRLITTCNKVKAAVDIPRIMAMTMLLPSVPGHRRTGERVWRAGECTAADRASHREGFELYCRATVQPKPQHDARDIASRPPHFLTSPVGGVRSMTPLGKRLHVRC